ncbi:MAG: hypothetical protein H6744_13500 [Deltaproteobacteria bacterium]|nr:hypothetical protein [Deltaproteobacteria bacterium]
MLAAPASAAPRRLFYCLIVAAALGPAVGCDSPSESPGTDAAADAAADVSADANGDVGAADSDTGSAELGDSASPDATPDAIEKLDVGPAPAVGQLYPGEPYESACDAWCARAVECLEADETEWKFCMYDCYANFESDRSYEKADCFALYFPVYTCSVAMPCEDFVLLWGLDDSDNEPTSELCADELDAYDTCAETDDGTGPLADAPPPSTNAALVAKLTSGYEEQCLAACDTQVRCPLAEESSPSWLECAMDCVWDYEYSLSEEDEACQSAGVALDACIATLTCLEWQQYWDAPFDATGGYPCAAEYVAYDGACDDGVVEFTVP